MLTDAFQCYQATKEDSPGERHLYKVTDFQSGQPGLVTCLSCDELNTRGGACGYNSFEFSSDKSYYAMSCDGPHVPQVCCHRVMSVDMSLVFAPRFICTRPIPIRDF